MQGPCSCHQNSADGFGAQRISLHPHNSPRASSSSIAVSTLAGGRRVWAKGIPPVVTRVPLIGRNVIAAGLAGVRAVDFAAERVGHERAVDDQLLGLRRGELARAA